jgi:hypothetical protein
MAARPPDRDQIRPTRDCRLQKVYNIEMYRMKSLMHAPFRSGESQLHDHANHFMDPSHSLNRPY